MYLFQITVDGENALVYMLETENGKPSVTERKLDPDKARELAVQLCRIAELPEPEVPPVEYVKMRGSFFKHDSGKFYSCEVAEDLDGVLRHKGQDEFVLDLLIPRAALEAAEKQRKEASTCTCKAEGVER